ncbi:MAG: hypothetical protein JWN64_148 [Parcubacteria group bacterium]|nr:hypothetical protein [Parcubacteria group bacterium]
MIAYLQLILIVLSGLIIAVADTIIKKSSAGISLVQALTNPWMLLAYLFYAVQIVFTVIVFMHHKELGIYANSFIVVYSLATIVLGIFIFKEYLSLLQVAGIVLALIGVVLMNSR